jgi:hypothetical protein
VTQSCLVLFLHEGILAQLLSLFCIKEILKCFVIYEAVINYIYYINDLYSYFLLEIFRVQISIG